MAMQYLTVQDMLWLNLEVTKGTQEFAFDRLEEAVFYQCGYGGSTDTIGQAARFVTGFVKMSPFARGNESCALVGLIAFLTANGYKLQKGDEDAAAFAESLWVNPSGAREAIEGAVIESPAHLHDGVADFREICEEVLEHYAGAIQTLALEKVES